MTIRRTTSLWLRINAAGTVTAETREIERELGKIGHGSAAAAAKNFMQAFRANQRAIDVTRNQRGHPCRRVPGLYKATSFSGSIFQERKTMRVVRSDAEPKRLTAI